MVHSKIANQGLRRNNKRRKNSRNGVPENLLDVLVYNNRPVNKDAQLIKARSIELHLKVEYICADLSSRPHLFPCSRTADHTYTATC